MTDAEHAVTLRSYLVPSVNRPALSRGMTEAIERAIELLEREAPSEGHWVTEDACGVPRLVWKK